MTTPDNLAVSMREAAQPGLDPLVKRLFVGVAFSPGKRPDDALPLRVPGPGSRDLHATFGYAQFETGFAAYVVDIAEIPARALGWAFGANTAAIVLGQLVTLKLIKGRRRTSMLALLP